MTTVHEGDLVLAALGQLGARVDCSGLPRLDLEGPQVLWLVASGALDLFAVDARQEGHWHHLGRLEAGSLLLGPVTGAEHTLVARPLRDCVVHRIGLRELYQPAQTQTWAYDAYGNPPYVPPESSPLEYALALGVGRGLSVLFQAPMGAERPAHTTDDDVFWMQVPPGSVRYGALYGAEAAADLLMDPAVWQGMVEQQYRLLTTLDRWIEQLERTHETRTAEGIKAGEAVRAQADRTLLAAIGGRPGSGRRPPTRTPRTRPASWSRTRRGSRWPRRSGRAPAATGWTRWNGSRSPRGCAPGPYAWTAAGGGTTWAPWSATGRCPGHRWRCCGGAAAMSPCIRRPGGRHRSRRPTRRSSSRAR